MEEAEPTFKCMQNWAELPADIMNLLFMKIGLSEVLLTAQFVCSSWSRISKQSDLYRYLDLRNQSKILSENNYKMRKVAWEACRRSSGELVEFATDKDFAVDDELLHYIVDNSNSLRYLCLGSMDRVSRMSLVEAVKKVPLLEELELSEGSCDCVYYRYCSFSTQEIREIGRSCSSLISFTLQRHQGCRGKMEYEENEFTYAIGKHMSKLCRIHLSGITLTDKSLLAMLDGCPSLELLDLEYCDCYMSSIDLLLSTRCDRFILILPYDMCQVLKEELKKYGDFMDADVFYRMEALCYQCDFASIFREGNFIKGFSA